MLSQDSQSPRRRKRFPAWLVVVVVILASVSAWLLGAKIFYPSDREPEGAYLRIVKAVNRSKPEEVFPYTEEAAQHACYTIRDYRRRALSRVRATFPEEERAELQARYGPLARARHGRDVFAHYARQEGWMQQLRRDLSGIESVERSGKRATVVTVRGTRYSFRRRPNGIWGLTAFTPTLVSEAKRAARDLALIEEAAQDYERLDAAE